MTNLDFRDKNLLGLYNNIQGNILKSHGRDHSRHIFIKFTGGEHSSRTWAARVGTKVTSFAAQYEQTKTFKGTGQSSLFMNFMLSATGYRALGIPEARWPDDKAFRAGMKDTTTAYDTRPRGDHQPVSNPLFDTPSDWEAQFQEQIDALIVLAIGRVGTIYDAEEALDAEVEALRAELGRAAEIVCIQKGHVLRNDLGQAIEHFGNPDGIGNPIFMRPDLDRARRQKGGFERADLSAPLGLVLLQEPGGAGLDYGSFFVYRKLQQNIAGYKQKCQGLADALNDTMLKQRNDTEDNEIELPEFDSDYASALCFGRFKDGTPISEQAVPGWSSLPNNFDFANDIRGRKCPFQSHIRKTNPRLDTRREFGAPQTVEFSRRIVRRGISYGDADLHPSEEWTEAGLLFLSCQRSIEYQFIFMQHSWCNNQDFVNSGTGVDPICGVAPPGKDPVPQKWPLRWGIPEGSVAGGADPNERDVEYLINDIVRMRGGEYFFAPSLSFLSALG